MKNSFITSVKQLQYKIKNDNYDFIISFGQAPLNKNDIKIETKATDEDFYTTNHDYTTLKDKLENNGFNVIISCDAGKYFCDNIYSIFIIRD